MLAALQPRRVVDARHGPAGFHWLVPGLLGGVPRPGAAAAMADDIAALARLGTRLLVSLTAEWTPDPAALAARGIASLHEPIPDFAPPTVAQAAVICRVVSGYLEDGDAVVFHCRAGRGRTGTLLAAQLVWHGNPAATALSLVRARNPDWVETAAQEAFLAEFEAEAAHPPGRITPPTR